MANNSQLYFVMPTGGSDDQYTLYNSGHYLAQQKPYMQLVMDQTNWQAMENMPTNRSIIVNTASKGVRWAQVNIGSEARIMNYSIAPEKVNLMNNHYFDVCDAEWETINGWSISNVGTSSTALSLNNVGFGAGLVFPSNTWTIEFFMKTPIFTATPNPLPGYFYIVDQPNSLAILAEASGYYGDLQGNYATSYQSGYYISPRIFIGHYSDSNNQYVYYHIDNTWSTGTLIHTAFTCNAGKIAFYWNGTQRLNLTDMTVNWGTNITFAIGSTVLLQNNGWILPAGSELDSIRISDNVRYTASFTPPVNGKGWTVDDHTLRLVQFNI